MKNICLVHSEDAKEWVNYLVVKIQEIKECRALPILDIELMLETSASKLQTANVLLLVLSHAFVRRLKATDLSFETNANAKRWAEAPNAEIIQFYCGVDETDLAADDRQNRPISERLPAPSDAEIFHTENHKDLISYLDKKLNARRKKPLNGKKSNGNIKVLPGQASAEGGTVLTLIFVDAPDEDNVIVEFPGDEVDEWTRVKAVCQADNVYTVVAPEHSVGDVVARVTESGKELGVIRLKFASVFYDVIAGINQLYVSIIDQLLEVASRKNVPICELDEALASTFDEKDLRKTIAAQVFEKFFGIYSSSNKDPNHKFPTPMHLVAKWDLRRLAKKFLDLPDAQISLNIVSIDQQNPAQLARSRNNCTIAEFLEKNIEDTDEFQEIYQTFLRYNTVTEPSSQNYYSIQKDLPVYVEDIKPKPLPKVNIAIKEVSSVNKTVECDLISAGFAHNKLQEDLILIMKQVKNNEISQEEANLLYRELQIKEQSLAANKKFLSKNNIQEFLRKKIKNIKKIGENSPKNNNSSFVNIQPSMNKRGKILPPEIIEQRCSTTSNSSRESSSSVQGYSTSGIEQDEPSRFANRKELPKLTEDDSPPPVPSRLDKTTDIKITPKINSNIKASIAAYSSERDYLPMTSNAIKPPDKKNYAFQKSFQEESTRPKEKIEARKNSEPFIITSKPGRKIPPPVPPPKK